MNVLSIDQGTTNTKALLISANGQVLARTSSGLTAQYPASGWVEQSADEIWQSVVSAIDRITEQAGNRPIDAIAIANQRETLVCWDADTSVPLAPAIVWQCRRSTGVCEDLIAGGHGPVVASLTGLEINPLFPASKFTWLMRNNPAARTLSDAHRLRIGTVDAWLIWKLTGGSVFATDHSNASRTQLFDTNQLCWSEQLGEIFEVPLDALPAPQPSDASFGETTQAATGLPAGIPIRAVMGDSHAALYGHGVRHPGAVKATFGTGSSLMTLTTERTLSDHGLSSTVAWTDKDGPHYALEGNITVSAQALSFIAGLLGAESVGALSDLAQSIETSEGVVFVPALAGLGAPYWDNSATGLITGMTHSTGPAHVARAAFEAVAHQVCDVFAAMEADIGDSLKELKVDGGPTSNDFLMQLQADLLGRPVARQDLAEIGALGVAMMAFASQGLDAGPIGSAAGLRFVAHLRESERLKARGNWARAISQATTS